MENKCIPEMKTFRAREQIIFGQKEAEAPSPASSEDHYLGRVAYATSPVPLISVRSVFY